MKVIICGAGRLGLSFAEYLEQSDNDIVVIDHNESLLREIDERHDIQTISGHASDPNVLKIAGADKADIIIAATASDEVNMIVCEIANGVFQIPTKIARIRNQVYLDPQWNRIFGPEKLSIDVVMSPEINVARMIAQGFKIPGAFIAFPMVKEQLVVIGTKCLAETPIVNTPISHICGIFPHLEFSVFAIWRKGELLIPSSNTRLSAGDDVYLVCRQIDTTAVMKAFGYYLQDKRKLLILGGGHIGFFLAREVEMLCPHVPIRIIESDKNRCLFLSQELSRSVVIEGNGLDLEILKEAEVESAETIISVTSDDKVNTLGTLLAKYNGTQRGIALISSAISIPLVLSLGVDVALDPRMITVSSILHHIRRENIHNAFTLPGNQHEILEVSIYENSTLTGSPIESFEIEGERQVTALVREDDVFFHPVRGNFERGDRVILSLKNKWIPEVQNFFFAKSDYSIKV